MLYVSIVSFSINFSSVEKTVVLESERMSVEDTFNKVSVSDLSHQGLFVVENISVWKFSEVDEVFSVHAVVLSLAESASADIKDEAAGTDFASEARLFVIDRM